MRPLDLIALARPKDWLKNLFVLMPVPFAMVAGGLWDPFEFFLGVFLFCLLNSAVYALNDTLDAKRDRDSARTRNRPVASGRVSQPAALTLSGALALTALAGPYWAGLTRVYPLFGLYVAINLIYNAGARRVPLVDIFLLATGFVLRVFLGCVLLGVVASNWLILCSSTLALLLALGKRRADVIQEVPIEHRPSLAGYTRAFLEQSIGITAGVALLSYALYCIEAEVLMHGREFASMPFVAFGIFEYLRLIHTGADAGSPVDLLLRSRTLVVSALGWVAAVLWSTGFL